MREILFTGKRVDNNEWVEGYVSIFGDTTQIFVPFTDEEIKENQGHFLSAINGVWHIVDPETVGEYIGLTDKDGRKIFEGHIVQDDIERKCVVRYLGGHWSPFAVYPEYTCWSQRDCKIIGNVHDNPELLKSE